MVKDLKILQREAARLRRENASLRRWVRRTGPGLDKMLARRGMRIRRTVPPHRLLPDVSAPTAVLDRLYALLHRYSFRLLLRDAIQSKGGFTADDLGGYCSPRAARRYLEELRGLEMVQEGPQGLFRLTRPSVNSFGETLEWFVAEILRREFFAEAVHGVAFRTAAPGGDFDVIACVEGLLLYVETKSSPPRGIEAGEMTGFLDRQEALAPHAALFLVDTHLRMGDKMVPILQDAMRARQGDGGSPPSRIVRLEREIFHVDHRLYLLNAARGITSNLRRCLLDHMRAERSVRGRNHPGGTDDTRRRSMRGAPICPGAGIACRGEDPA
jgi:hypothetical protein